MRKDFEFNFDKVAERVECVEFARPKGERVFHGTGLGEHAIVYLYGGKARLKLVGGLKSAGLKSAGQKSAAIVLKQGDLFYAPPALSYRFDSLEDSRALHVSFSLKDGQTLFSRKMLTVIPGSLLRVSEAEETLLRLKGVRLPFQHHYLLWWIHELFYHLGEIYSSFGIPPKFQKLLPVTRELEEKFAENEKLSHYARLCGMSESGFRKLFLEFTGKTFVEYRNELRLSCARRLLKSAEYTVKEAAAAVGIENIGYFCRLYKRKFGVTAGAERRVPRRNQEREVSR